MLREQLKQILSEFNDTARNYPSDICIHQLFAQQVEKTPSAVAVSFEEQSLTYHQLNERANQLGHYLQKLGVKPETLVGICLERSLEMIIGLLGILKAGGAYLPLDPRYPQERLKFMVEDAQLSLLVTQERLTAHLPFSTIPAICLDRDWQIISQQSQQNPSSSVKVENLAYILYTSGSTGLPKGVLITHKGLSNLATAEIELFNLQPSSRVIQFASLNFDVSVSEILTTLCSGAQLCLGSPNSLLPGVTLLEFLQKQAITHAALSPSVLAELPQASLNDLQVIIVGGEACPTNLMRQWALGRRFFNAYGPTEATVEATIAECSPDEPINIGRPIANTQAYILDESLQPVSIGVTGELHIGGVGLARGYLNRPELTQAKFIPHPFSQDLSAKLYKTGDLARYLPDGKIEWLGRIDNQVKIRGLRIELEEIEAILQQNPVIRQAVVIPRSDQFDGTFLIAYVVINPLGETESFISQWRNDLKEKLPHYMIPGALVILEKLPLTPNDKVDRLALAQLPLDSDIFLLSRETFIAPRNPTEEILAKIWAEVLGLARVGIKDNFFDLGGHSLKAVILCDKLLHHLDKRITIENILDAPTVAEFAVYLQETEPNLMQQIEGTREINPWLEKDNLANFSQIEPGGSKIRGPLSFTQQKKWSYQKLNPIIYYCGNFRRYHLGGELNLAALTESFNEMIRRHQPLRTTFCEIDGLPMQVVNDAAEVNLSIIDLQNLPEKARNEEAEKLAKEIRCYPWDLENGPLMRIALIRIGEKSHILLLHIHDILIDHSSFILLFQELSILYEAFVLGKKSPLPTVEIQYLDYVQWQLKSHNPQVMETKSNYWKQWFSAGEPPFLQLPINQPPTSSLLGANESFEISTELTQKLKILSQQQKTTLFMIGVAAFATLLYSYSGCEDIVIRAPYDCRNQEQLKPLIGVISNVMMLRIDLRGNPSFLELLKRVRQVVLEAFVHQDIPLEQLKAIKAQNYFSKNLFKTVIGLFSESPQEECKLLGLDVTFLEMEEFELRPDLELAIWEKRTDTGTSLGGWWQYKKDYFEVNSIAKIAEDFIDILEVIAANPRQLIKTIKRSYSHD